MTGSSEPPVWHALPSTAALERLGSAESGLSPAEAAARLARDGPNRLRRTRRASALRILADQLRSVVVFLLLAATAVSLALGDLVDAAAIGAVLLINASLGFATELRARRAMEALAEIELGVAVVVRAGARQQIDSAELVRGDVIELAAGRRVPADARLLESHDLRCDEAALTGESLPVEKRAGDALAADTLLAERANMVYKGTSAARGSGSAVVVATAAATELGRIGALVGGLSEERTPLERKLDALGRQLAWLVVAVAAVVAALSAWQGAPLGLVLQLGIALAVAAVPEALPAVATIALAIGLHRMARRNALVRRLPAVEALGAATVVCSDKTRTLTSGDMTAVELWVDGAVLELDRVGGTASLPAARALLECAALASSGQPTGAVAAEGADPVDRAMHAGLTRLAPATTPPRPVAVLPFSSERMLLANFYGGEGGRLRACVKGAPQRVAALCTRRWTPHGGVPLDDVGRAELLKANEAFAARALRVLAVACGDVRSGDEASLRELELVGLVGLMDPPAPGVHATIATLRDAGLRTLMLTGDQRLTAETIGRQLGLASEGSPSLDGRELDALDADALQARVADTAVYSRISPEHKLRIVEALQARGEIVAMLGDGVNDAPALKKADVGVAMGRRGTDVAREAADIVLRDDRFETIAAAVEEGRVIDANIRKFVFYLFSCNTAEVLVLFVAGLLGWPHPLAPLQILWLNLVTDTFPALALALEPADRGVMTRPPQRADLGLVSRPFLLEIAAYGVLITAVTLLAFWLSLADGEARARTVAFMTLAFAQILHVGTARSAEPVLTVARALANHWALAAVALSIALQAATVAVAPLEELLALASLDGHDWLRVAALSALPAIVGQAARGYRSRV